MEKKKKMKMMMLRKLPQSNVDVHIQIFFLATKLVNNEAGSIHLL